MIKHYAVVHSLLADVTAVTPITIECDISNGLHSFSVIGLTDKAIDESKDRVGAAIKNTGFTSPKTQNQKVTISLAPSDLKKEGPQFDLPIALSYLLASNQITFDTNEVCFLGELTLSGELRKVRGVLPIVRAAKKFGFKTIFVPHENKEEASLIEDIEVYAPKNLEQVINHLHIPKQGERKGGLEPVQKQNIVNKNVTGVNFNEIKGQFQAKRALLLSAAGGHNVALYGPPGTGKTMLAKAFTSILPELSKEEAFEVASIHSVAGVLEEITTTAPLRSPHHTSSHVAIVGGGTNPRPGEITLAHHGVLFMDEFPEFDKRVLESLREPLEEGYIRISRAKGRALFPSDFILIAALNPCPCGNKGNPLKRCVCSARDIERYTKKLSGPIMDRIDMWVEVSHVNYDDLHKTDMSIESTSDLKLKVVAARETQKIRNQNKEKYLNKHLTGKDMDKDINIKPDTLKILQEASGSLALSPRSYYKVLKLARTIADVEKSESVETPHILEALQYRPKI